MLKDGSFDKQKNSDTSSVKADEWFSHFSNLLGKSHNPTEVDLQMEQFFKENVENISSDLDNLITKSELIKAIKRLKNNKSTSFDKISNEMLKHGLEPLSKSLLLIFNTILSFNIYPIEWKKDILGPLHKSGDKADPNNFRGICVSSCLGKLFNSILRNRLEEKCRKTNLINKCQASGKIIVRTSDHLLVLKHIIHKYTKVQKQKLYICFFDLRKAFDFVPRTLLFHTLLTQYKIGGKFLKILKNIYTNNQMFIKTDQGLTKPFVTSTGVKQGCIFSPILFNLFINKLPDVFDSDCHPVLVNSKPVHCLMWADDYVVMSTSESGLQRSINKTVSHFSQLGLTVNKKKTKVMVFNARGLGPKNSPS